MPSTVIPEQHRRLGRHVEHDDRSRQFPALRASALRSVKHARHCAPFDQGNLGSCTGNAMAGLLMSDPAWKPGRRLREHDAVELYSLATSLDSVPGIYPPNDTGSTGIAVARAAVRKGYIAGYSHAFGLDHALAALVLGAEITGVNWYDSMDAPDSNGLVSISPNAGVRGGHEFEVAEINVEHQLVGCWQSWGPHFAIGGYFYMRWDTWGRLLSERGDVTKVR